MRTQMRVLGLGMFATILVAACSGSTATRRLPAWHPRRPASAPASAATSEAPASPAADGQGPAPAAVGAAGAVRGLLRGRRPGLLQGRGPRRSTSSTAARRSSRSRSARAPDGPEFTISWVPEGARGARGRLGPRRHRPDLPALRHPDRCPGRTANITDPASLAGKKVGVWDFGNEFEVTAGLPSRGLTPGSRTAATRPQYQKVIQDFDMSRSSTGRSTSPRR